MKNTKQIALWVCLTVTMVFVSCESETTQETSDPIETSIALDDLIKEALSQQPYQSTKYSDSLETVDFVDLDRYDGRWYEIAKFPNPFEQDCACTTADYELVNGQVNVLNNCTLTTTGEFNSITGNAIVADTETNAKLILTLNGIPFPADYWIIDLISGYDNESYQFAVVSGPSRQNLFILSRTPKINTFRQKISVIKLLINLTIKGFDIRNLEITPQNEDCVYP